MASGRSVNAFTTAFLQGFSVVDNAVQARNRNQLLEQRLEEEREQRAFQNERLRTLDAERAADRLEAQTEREYQREQRRRGAEATALMSDPNVDPALLEDYRDIPQVAAFFRDRGLQEDAAYVFGNQAPAPGAPGTGQPGSQAPGIQGQALEAAELPPGPGGPEPVPVISAHELNRMGDVDPQAALEYRQRLEAQGDDSNQPGFFTRVVDNLFNGPTAEAPHERKERLEREERIRNAEETITDQWATFYDMNNAAGDEMRNIQPQLLVDMYFDDRNSIDPEVRENVDRRMGQHVQHSINLHTAIIANSDPNSEEAARARVNLSKAYGVANAIGHDYQPLRMNGVDGRGLPNNNNNPQLTDAVIMGGINAPGFPYPNNPNQTRSDMTMVQRGTGAARISDRFAQASWRLLKGGIITNEQYSSLMRTGRLPASQPELVHHNPKEDLLAVYPNGQVQIVIPARDPDASRADWLRNTIGEDGLSQMNRWASALDDEFDDARGTRMMMSFSAALAQNEGKARARGYDYSNFNDITQLWQRFQQIAVFRDAYNQEWAYNGNWNPDFTEDFTSLGDALFDPRVDTAVGSGEFENPEGDGSVVMTPLRNYTQQDIQAVIQSGRARTPEEAAQVLQSLGL